MSKPHFLMAMQETERAALEAAKKEESSSSSSSEDSDSDSQSSHVGLGKAERSKPKAKAKSKGVKAKAPAPPPTHIDIPPAVVSAPSSAPESARSEKSFSGTEAASTKGQAGLIDKAAASLRSLQDVTALMIWNGQVKGKDLDSKLSKAMDLNAKCEAKITDAAAQEAASKLSQEISRLSLESNVFSAISSHASDSDLKETLLKNSSDLLHCCLMWTWEELLGFLADLGRKLCDLLITSQGNDDTFFYFLSCKKNPSWEGFSLSLLKLSGDKPEGWGQTQDDELLRVIGQVQHASLNYFIDRFRSMSGDVEKILRAIPTDWYLPEICRRGVHEKHWLINYSRYMTIRRYDIVVLALVTTI